MRRPIPVASARPASLVLRRQTRPAVPTGRNLVPTVAAGPDCVVKGTLILTLVPVATRRAIPGEVRLRPRPRPVLAGLLREPVTKLPPSAAPVDIPIPYLVKFKRQLPIQMEKHAISAKQVQNLTMPILLFPVMHTKLTQKPGIGISFGKMYIAKSPVKITSSTQIKEMPALEAYTTEVSRQWKAAKTTHQTKAGRATVLPVPIKLSI